uniref:Sulfate adenylyltransferase subunit 2 n=1 Tax=Sphingomonas elodea TaxID=179878 RepID=A4UTT3_SPHEL|nr:sulfate adenylate transferase small subunit [Sphingomonas elodea]
MLQTSTMDTAPASPAPLTHLQRLEAESIHILREVAAEAERPVMLYSIGKDSAVMLHLARKAFHPAPPPFPLLHVDTTWKFKAMYEMRERSARRRAWNCWCTRTRTPRPAASTRSTMAACTPIFGRPRGSSRRSTDMASMRRSAARGATRKRAAPRSASSASAPPATAGTEEQRPELWRMYMPQGKARASGCPAVNWTELDIWQYILAEGIEIVPLYFAAPRPTVERDGMLLMVDDERFRLRPGEVPVERSIRFRTLGCYPLTGAVESTADTLETVIQEMLLTTTSERQGRAIDHDQAASMEKKKQEGYF